MPSSCGPPSTTPAPPDNSNSPGPTIDSAHLGHVWPSHHENINLYGVHTVDIADELARLDPDGYRPLRHPHRTPT